MYCGVDHLDLFNAAAGTRGIAYLECVRSTVDRSGSYGLPERWQGMDCFTSFGGSMKYIDVLAIYGVVCTLETRSRHMVLHTRERFCRCD